MIMTHVEIRYVIAISLTLAMSFWTSGYPFYLSLIYGFLRRQTPPREHRGVLCQAYPLMALPLKAKHAIPC